MGSFLSEVISRYLFIYLFVKCPFSVCLFLSAHIGAALFGFHTAKFLLSPLGFRRSPEPQSRWAVWIVSHLWATDPPPSPAPCVVLNYSWIPFNNKGPPLFPSLPPLKKLIINECSWSLPTCSTHTERSHSSCSVNRAYIFFSPLISQYCVLVNSFSCEFGVSLSWT